MSIHKKLRELNSDDIIIDFDATYAYPGAMYDENSVTLK